MKKAPPWVDEVVSADGPYPMSPKLVREILKDADLSTNEKVVFVYMVSRRLWCDKARVKDMADDLSMSEKMVARAIKTLEDLGHIYRQGRPRDRIVLMAPPWLRYDVRKPTFKTDIETDNVSLRHGLRPAGNGHPQTDNQTDNPRLRHR